MHFMTGKRIIAYRAIALVTVLGVLLCGCGDTAALLRGKRKTEKTTVTQEETLHIITEHAEGTQDVAVDRLGYTNGQIKRAVVSGGSTETGFTVYDKMSRKPVYRAALSVRENAAQKQNVGYADFSAVTEPGTYYISVDQVGRSYDFIIHDNLYDSLFQRLILQFQGDVSMSDSKEENEQAVDRNTELSRCRALIYKLSAFELFGEVFGDEGNGSMSGNGIPDILDICMEEGGKILEREPMMQDSGSICLYQSAALSRLAYLCKGYDTSFSGKCRNSAVKLYGYAGKTTDTDRDAAFLASVELWRLTQGAAYGSAVREYLTELTSGEGEISDTAFWGLSTYLNMGKGVNTVFCESIMKRLSREAEAMSEQSRSADYYVYDTVESKKINEYLEKVMRMCFVNRIITNYEYSTVIENHLHYLMGANPNAECMYRDWSRSEELNMSQLKERYSAVLFILSEIIVNRTVN